MQGMSDDDQDDRVCEAFLKLLDLDDDDRQRALAQLDVDLRRSVERMLQDYQQPAPILRQLDAADRSRAVPRIAGYQIEGQIGEGGMGVVYRATQDRPRRNVAIKMLLAGSAIRDDGQRFEREIAALGLLQHPGICRIYNAGLAEGTHGGLGMPWFAMELVDGLPMVEYANAQGLGWRDRCGLVIQVCAAVEHAHERGVVHRDLKPANILVVHGGEDAPVVKILDFGIARMSAGDAVAEHKTQTGFVLGTLNYMSPEQFSGAWASVDGRTDVYAIGVLLFELLTGGLPLDVSERPFAEIARLITDSEPKRPSKLRPELPSDVDKVVRKALEKLPEDRYLSAAQFGADLQRVLRDQPVTAQPATLFYQLRKFARRNRVLVGGVIATILSLVLGLGAALLLLDENRQLANGREAARIDAVQKGQDLRAALYATEMQLCGQSMQSPAGASLQRELIQRWLPSSAARLPDGVGSVGGRGAGEVTPRDLRGFEWYLAWASCHREQLVAECGTDWHGMWWMPSQDSIYSAGRIWSAKDGRLLRSFGDRACQSDLSGSVVLDALGDRRYGIRRADAAQPHASFQIPGGLNRSAFSPDSTLLACYLKGLSSVRIYDTQTAEVLAELPSRGSGCYEIAWSGDSQLFAMTYPSPGENVGVWRRGDWSQPFRDLKGKVGRISGLCFDRSGHRVACSGNKGALVVWELETSAVLLELDHAEGLLDVTFHPSGDRVACGCFNGAVYIHDIGGERAVDVRRGHRERVEAVAYDSSGKHLAAVAGGYLRIWPTGTPPVCRAGKPRELRKQFEQLTWSPDSSAVSSRLLGETYHLDESADASSSSAAAGRTSLGRMEPFETRWLQAGVLRVDGARFTLPLAAGEPATWSAGPADLLGVLSERNIFGIAGKGGLYLFGYGELDADGKPAWLVNTRRATTWFQWTPDRQRLIRLDRDGYIDMLDADTLDKQGQVRLETKITSFDIDATTDLFAFGCSDHSVRLWSEQNGERAVLSGHLGVVRTVAFLPGGTRVASGATDGTVRIWSVDGAVELMALKMSGPVLGVAWSPNGYRLAALDQNGKLTVWDASEAYRQGTELRQRGK